MEFGYWKIKGRAQPIRWLLAYTGLPIEEYTPETREEWNKRKEALRLQFPFPNLPFFYDKVNKIYISDVKAVFSQIAYLANKPEMTGKCERDKIQVEMLYGVIIEMKSFFLDKADKTVTQIQDSFEEECNNYLMAQLHGLSRYLQEKDFFLVYLSIVDFELAYLFDLFEIMCQQCELNHPWNAFPNLFGHKDRVKNLPGVKEYIFEEKEGNLDFFKKGQLAWI